MPQTEKKKGLNTTIKALGLVSMLSDISSEMVYPINPIFITRVLGAPAWSLGLIEGIAESVASLLKLYSGWLSDRMGRRKPFAVMGYGLGALGKPIIAAAGGWPGVLLGRTVDRLGKGLRTAPRDALVTENVSPELRGRAFGFHRSMDTIGAVLGPLIGFFLVSLFARNHGLSTSDLNHSSSGPLAAPLQDIWKQAFRWIYWVAFIPGTLGVFALLVFVQETGRERKPVTKPVLGPTVSRTALPGFKNLNPVYKRYLLIVALFSIGNSSDSFLILRAQSPQMGIGPQYIFLLYALFNVMEAFLAYPAGHLSDRIGRRPLLITGYIVFSLVYLGFALLQGPLAAIALFVIYGFYYTLTSGAQRALAADLAHPERRGAEIGAFHMVVGISALPASILAGWLYVINPVLPFVVGAACAGAAAILLSLVRLDKSAGSPVH